MTYILQIIMDLHLELEEEEVEYLESIGIAETLGETLTQALKSLSSEKPPEPLLSLVVEGMARAAGKGLLLWESHVVIIKTLFFSKRLVHLDCCARNPGDLQP